jgi:hypothetical protein
MGWMTKKEEAMGSIGEIAWNAVTTEQRTKIWVF